jgi:hypothetical protein
MSSMRTPSMLALGFFVGSCAAQEPKAPPPAPLPSGHFVLAERLCDQHRIVAPSVAEWLELSEGGRGSWSIQAPGCQRRLPDVRFVATAEGGLLLAEEIHVLCEPRMCAVAVASVVDGRPSRTTVDCPSREQHDYTFSIAGPKLTLRMTDRDCVLEFNRQ